jgi:FMN phosphatase YigB (HAD superfamily)
MRLRIGFDMDGVLADFAGAYHAVERRLFGIPERTTVENPETVGDDEPPAPSGRRTDAVWQVIRETPDFWQTLDPTEPDAVQRIHEMAMRHRWEVFFITQRPATLGETVQRQTQRWLARHGFDLPSVLVINGPRGAAAGALRLDYHVDDSPSNCIDVKCESPAKPILIVEDDDLLSIASARRLGIGTAPAIGHALDILEQASQSRDQPGILQQLAALVGWK